MGAKIEILNERVVSNEKVADIRVVSSPLNGTTIERSMIPRLIDEIPIITVAASVAKGTTTITGLKGFKTKESGKLSRMIAELSKLGATLHETEDGVIIEVKNTSKHCGGSHNDAAIAMSLVWQVLLRKMKPTSEKHRYLI